MNAKVIQYPRTEQGIRIVPVYRDESKDYFVDAEKIHPWEVEVDGQRVLTAALKIGETFDLLGISQSQALLETGIHDTTDAISPNMALESIWIQRTHPDGSRAIDRHILAVADARSPYATFAARNTRQLELNYTTSTLPGRVDGDVVKQKLELVVAGTINLQLGHAEVVASGVVATPDDGTEYEVIGYTLQAYRENMNRRPVNLQAAIDSQETRLDPAQDEREERAFVPVISVFSGAPHPGADYFAKGKVITTHEVPGAASNLTITVGDDPAVPGNANHRYDITGFDTDSNASEWEGSFARALNILFQNGPIPSHGNNGVTLEALYAVAAHRLQGFQAGPFASADNEEALFHTLKALEALQRRTRTRIARQVEGTYQA